ncbi:MAG TPA: hypothetical protein VG826_25305 [Pirellulales bacterium]|nr:hypothetical protein [Pirellulales bacterium]
MKEVAPPRRGHNEHCQMQVTCPRCGGQGLVPWNRLDRILHCGVCRAWCRLDRFGKPFEVPAPNGFWIQVRTSFSGWKRARVFLGSEEADEQSEPRAAGGRTVLLVASALAVALAVGGIAMSRPGREVAPAAPVKSPVPDSLEGRATLWASAWLARDTGQLLQLVERTRDRDLRRWLLKHPPPTPAEAPPGEPAAPPRLAVTSTPVRQPNVSDVTLTIETGRSADKPGVTELRQVWYQREGVWYFWPN